MLALEVDGATREQRPDHGHGLLQPRRPLGRLRKVDAVGKVLRGMTADTDAQLHPAGSEIGDGHGHARQHRRVAVHDIGHEAANA